MVKLIAIDLDGTLINSDSKISEKDEKALINCNKLGLHIVIVSAKSILAVMKIANKFSLKSPQIGFGGAIITLLLQITHSEIIPPVSKSLEIIMT